MSSTGILKKQPRYSKANPDNNNNNNNNRSSSDRISKPQNDRTMYSSNDVVNASGIKGNVVERKSLPNPFVSSTLHNKSSTSEPKKIKSKPAKNSLAQLIAKGSAFQEELRSDTDDLSNNVNESTAYAECDVKNKNDNTIEAELEFSCMTQEDFHFKTAIKNESDSEKDDVATYSECDDDNEEEQENEAQFVTDECLRDQLSELSMINDDMNFDGLSRMEKMGLLMFGGMEEIEEEKLEIPVERPFMMFWQTLSSWTTHLSSNMVKQWINNESNISATNEIDDFSVYDKTDVGYSRCNGLMAMIKMNLPKVWLAINSTTKPLGANDQRVIELRMGKLVRSFDFSLPVPKLNTNQWRMMTLLLLEMTIVRLGEQIEISHIPSIVSESGLSLEEYKYLIRSSIPTLSGSC